jgi:hypothetical protein
MKIAVKQWFDVLATWHGIRIAFGVRLSLGSSDVEDFLGRIRGGVSDLVRAGGSRGDVAH